MSTYIIKTLGCKVNQYESEAVSQALKESGFEKCETGHADVCIINTCTVTSKASMQSRQMIRQLIRSNPNARIVVTGCYAQTEKHSLQQIDGIHDIVSNSEKHVISDLVSQPQKNLNDPANPQNPSQDFFTSASPSFEHRTRPFLKIQDGCDAFCSYCIVPYARGTSRSMPFETVRKNIRKLKESGTLEIVLTGIHLGKYGLDLNPPKSLFELLCTLNESNAIKRLRLSSIEPQELNSDIIHLVKSSEMLCKHFHIPLQSGNDPILKAMNRPYSRSFFKDLILSIHEAIPEISIGLDVIIGFPGETNPAFEDTYSFIMELPVSYLHVFPFSPRQGTPAATLPGKVPDAVIKHRSKRMRDLGNQKKITFYQQFIGKEVDVLAESARDKNTGLLKGFTSNYIPVLIDGPDILKNTIIYAKIKSVDKNIAKGKILDT